MVFLNAWRLLTTLIVWKNAVPRLALIMLWAIGGLAVAQDQDPKFEVGDLIEFEFHGKKQQQEVLELVGSGWMRVEADFSNRKVRHLVVPRDATLIRRANAQELQEDFRTWTDATGKFKVDATIYELTDTEVKLLKKDEKVVTIPLEKLSAEDRQHLSEVRAKRAAEINPFAGGTPVEPAKPMGDVDMFAGGVPDTPTKPTTPMLENGALPIEGSIVRPDNEVALDSAEFTYQPTESRPHVMDKSISLPPSRFSSDYQVHTNSKLFYSGNSGELIAIYRTNPFQKFSQAIIVDTQAEEVVGDFTLPYEELNDFVVSPSKQSVVTIHNSFGNDEGGIVFWKPDNQQLVPERAWRFDPKIQFQRFYAHSSIFLDDQHLFTVGSHLALWDLESGHCLYSVSNPGTWVISRDHSHIVFFQKGSLWIMRLRDGALVGQIRGDHNFMASLRVLEISPDGRSLVASTGTSLHGFDLTNGQSLFSFDSGYAISSVVWADNSLLLVNGGRVVDPKLEIDVWNFSLSHGLYRAQTGSTTWIVTPDQVFGLELINENRRREIVRNTSDLDPQDLLAFGVGSRVALSTDLAALGNESESVIQKMRERLEKLGFVIDDSAPLRIEAVVSPDEEVQEIVRDHFGSLFGPVQERIRYTPHMSSVTLTLNDEVLWQIAAKYSASGPILRMEGNETPQDAADRLCKPNPAFFTMAAFPAKISRLPQDRPPGKSVITAAGLQ
jgi:hypothetical protein